MKLLDHEDTPSERDWQHQWQLGTSHHGYLGCNAPERAVSLRREAAAERRGHGAQRSGDEVNTMPPKAMWLTTISAMTPRVPRVADQPANSLEHPQKA
jgi:hypothetical protein